MAPTKQPAPVGQAKQRHDRIDDGTLARTRSQPPSTIGGPGSSGPSQTAPGAPVPVGCLFLDPRSNGTVRAPEAAFDRLRANSGVAAISAPRSTASQAWAYGAASAAIEQAITIDGRVIAVVRPTDADAAGKNLPTTAQLAEALRAIPASQRAHTNRVILSPNPHSDSTPTATTAGEAGGGVITLFPMRNSQSQNAFDNRLMHESGHNYQGSLWNSGTAVRDWQAAATADHRIPSAYAGGNAGDDFCEFGILYNTARGTPCEVRAKELYPNRWAKMVAYP